MVRLAAIGFARQIRKSINNSVTDLYFCKKQDLLDSEEIYTTDLI